MDFRDLTYIRAIAEHQSITKAANALYISQPTLSKFLLQTEDTLGQKLFDRIGKKYVLTYAGERYVAYATQILALKTTMDEELSDIVNLKEGQLHVGFSSVRGSEITLNTVPTFTARHPNVHLHLEETDGYSFEKLLLAGDLDLVFINLPVHDSKIAYEVISLDPVLLVASQDSPLREKACTMKGCNYSWLDLSYAKDESFILPPKNMRLSNIINEQLRLAHFAPKVLFHTRNLEAACILASRGQCVTFTIEQYIKHTRFDTPPLLFNIGTPPCYRSFVAAYRKGAYLPNYAREMIKIAKEQLSIYPHF